MTLSNLGIFHTIVGLISLISAVISFTRYSKISLERLTGKLYLYGTVITSITALGLSKNGGFNAGHIFSLFILMLVLTAYYLNRKRKGSKRARHFENFTLSFSFFLSLVPTVNETFTRIPVGHPLATGPSDPIIGKTLLCLFATFVIGTILQYRKQCKINKLQ
ncbi:hypothetical protein [Arachidicoccus terrestris]|uniref:hypothetical protein n=1 Tax=Arachidicoccus terrestris TaxID=2875539 RepID=UPI001CC35917|nr:hypothetical protein [Arachidicoccus terrestris]UAY54159.1 hypothetical protein K9M52_11905 [Arachidicoccus terrestris]